MKRMKQIIALTAFMLSIASLSHAQQQGIFSQMGNNSVSYNPAFTGLETCRLLSFGHRTQWAEMSDAPDQQYINYSTRLFRNFIDSVVPYGMPISNEKLYNELAEPELVRKRLHSGIGAHLARDEYGPFSKVSALINYAYHRRIDDNLNFSIGASLGASYVDINKNKLRVLDDGDDVYDRYMQQNASSYYLDGTFGALLYNKDLYVGYGANQIFMNRPFQQNIDISEYQARMHHMLSAGYVIRPFESLELVPMLNLMKTRAAPMSFNVGMKARLHKILWTAINFRLNEAVNARVGVMAFNKVMVNYSYEMATTKVRRYSGGTHEVGISLLFNATKAPKHLW